MPGSRGRTYNDRTLARGKTHAEAMRCLRRRLGDHVWRSMINDERRMAAGPGGQAGATLTSSAAGLIPEAGSSERPLPGPTTRKPYDLDAAVSGGLTEQEEPPLARSAD